jgi:response regulator of citrate/malate metabolism
VAGLDADKNSFNELGASIYLVKPVKFECLMEMMKALHMYRVLLAEKLSMETTAAEE